MNMSVGMTTRKWYQKWTVWAVIAFVVIFTWGYITQNKAEATETHIGLGHGATNNNDWIAMHLAISRNHWYLAALRTGGEDETFLPDTWRFSVGYRVDWRKDMKVAPFMKFGAAYWLDEPSNLISDHWSYDMSVGTRFWNVMELEWQHNSTAGRSDFNKGNDIIVLGFVFPVK